MMNSKHMHAHAFLVCFVTAEMLPYHHEMNDHDAKRNYFSL